MKHHAPLPVAVSLCLLAGAPTLGQAQTKASSPAVPQTASSKAAPQTEPELDSVTTLLRLSAAQMTSLDRAYETYARARLEQEARIAGWQDELRTAQAAATFDERKATQLSGNISGSENKIASAYLKARGEALGALTSLQRIELEKLAVARTSVLGDKYRFLLLSQVEDLWRTPLDPETGQALLDANSSATAAVRSQRNYYQNYYPAAPIYNYPLYSYGWNSYNYGWNDFNYGVPFYSRPNYRWNDDNYSRNDRVDRNARQRWDRTEGDRLPPVIIGRPNSVNSEPRRPLYAPQPSAGSSSRPSPSVERPREERSPIAPSAPSWERQRESPRPQAPRVETPRPEPPRPDPPRVETRRPEPSYSDTGSRWNRGGGGRESSGGGSRGGRSR